VHSGAAAQATEAPVATDWNRGSVLGDNTSVRIARPLLIVALGAPLTASVGLASTTAAPLVSCGNIIGQVPGPREAGYRPALGVLSVPPAYTERSAVRVTGFGRWTYWFKAGMVVHSGRFTVSVSVPQEFRSRIGITWGGTAIVDGLRFSGCGDNSLVKGWNGYAGGFYLRGPTACVPLVVERNGVSETLHFGIGKRC
jgi:hypothetical protein